jgi:subfamily B ATP-binding cassette protein MsbA
MLRLDPVLALLAVVSAPAAAVVSNRFGGRIRSMSLDVHRRESDVYAHAERTLGGMRTVQAFGRESYELERFRRQADGSRSAMLRLVTEQTVFGLVIDLVLALGMALVTYVAARRSLDGHLTTGEVLVFLAYAGSLYGPVAGLASVFSELQAAAAGAQRVFEVLDAAQVPDRPKALAPSPRALGVIRFEDVTFAYHDQHPVLHGVSFDAAPGETVALVGPTGAGKSTIASLLLRLYDVDEGQVQLDGNDVRGVPLGWLRGQIALVPQDPVLFPDTILENIRYGRLDASDSEVEEAAYEANLLDEIRRMPQQMHTPVGDRGVMLSGGQRQRVAIARAILRDAPVVVLDEPTSALDAGTEVQVMTAIDRLVAGRTCLVIAHRLATVRGADRVLVVADGRIVQQGTHRSLVRRNGLYRELHAARFGVAA